VLALPPYGGRLVHAQEQPYVLELFRGGDMTRALVVEDALFCGACTPRPDPIDLPELDE